MRTTRISVLCRWKEGQPVSSAFFSHYVKIASDFRIVACGSREQSAALSTLKERYPISSVKHMEGANASQAAAYFNTKFSRSLVGRWAYIVNSDEFVELPFLSVMETICELEASGTTGLPAVVLNYSAPTTWLEEPTPIPTAQCGSVTFPLIQVKTETVLGFRGGLPSEPVETALQGVIHCVPMFHLEGIDMPSTDASVFPVLVHRSALRSNGLLRGVKSELAISAI